MLSDLVDLVLPSTCALCHRPGASLCTPCRIDVTDCLHPAPRPALPTPSPPGMPSCWVSGEASGALRAVVTAYKDENRRDLAPHLVGWLAPALRAVVGTDEPAARALSGRGLVVVPVTGSPRARRRRGDVPLLPLVSGAAATLAGRVVVATVLAPTRTTADQSTLDAVGRAANVGGAMTVRERHAGVLAGAVCVVVDDLVTTGATFAEAARALHEAGAAHVVGAAIGATRRRLFDGDQLIEPPGRMGGGRGIVSA